MAEKYLFLNSTFLFVAKSTIDFCIYSVTLQKNIYTTFLGDMILFKPVGYNDKTPHVLT